MRVCVSPGDVIPFLDRLIGICFVLDVSARVVVWIKGTEKGVKSQKMKVRDPPSVHAFTLLESKSHTQWTDHMW